MLCTSEVGERKKLNVTSARMDMRFFYLLQRNFDNGATEKNGWRCPFFQVTALLRLVIKNTLVYSNILA